MNERRWYKSSKVTARTIIIYLPNDAIILSVHFYSQQFGKYVKRNAMWHSKCLKHVLLWQLDLRLQNLMHKNDHT